MKKKLLLTALLAVMVVSMSMFVGCFKGWNDGARIAFGTKPASTYYVGDGLDNISFTLIDLNDENKKELVSFVNGKADGVTVTGFDTSKVGTGKFSVKYGNYSIDWSYKVLSKEEAFAGGTGYSTDPYKIETTAQFRAMLKNGISLGKKYYEITRDLDFSDEAPLQQPMYYDHGQNTRTVFEAVISGGTKENPHTISGLDKIVDETGKTNSKRAELFGYVGNFTLKNIVFNFSANSADCVSGLVTTAKAGSEVVFENVKTTGEIDCNNFANTSVGVFMSEASRHTAIHSVSFKNCVNEVNIKNSSTQSLVAGFVNTQQPSTITFENCENKGEIQGAAWAAGGFMTLADKGKNVIASFKNCKNTGKIIKTAAAAGTASQFVAVKNAETQFAVATGNEANGSVDDSLVAMTGTVDETTLKVSATGAPKGTAYFKVVCISGGGITYSNGVAGTFLFNQKFAGATLTDAQLRKIKLSATKSDAAQSGEYGNANIYLDGEILVYTETNLAKSIDVTKAKLYIFAYDSNGSLLGYSGELSTVVNLAA